MEKIKFNIRASSFDARDFVYKQETPAQIKPSVDLRPWDSLVEDQGDLGSCAGNAMTNCYELMVKQKYPDKFVELSRLYVYYYTRLLENTLSQDSGVMSIRNMIRAVQKYGVCREELWPYIEDRYDDEPSQEARDEARWRTVTEYRSVRAQTDMLAVLNQGSPLIVGIYIYENFLNLSPDNAVIAVSDENNVSLGGHAVAILGYDLEKQAFLIKNSSGAGWGDRGYAWITFGYAELYMFDCWQFDINDQETPIGVLA